jgi:hypothetical protein
MRGGHAGPAGDKRSNRRQKEKEMEQNDRVNDRVDDTPRESSGSQWGEPTDPPVVEISYEEMMEIQDEIAADETGDGDLVDTQYTDGSTSNVFVAMDQGLVYDPPDDPPVIPSDDLQGVEIAAGFAPSMEEADLDVEELPPRVDGNDADLEEDIGEALRYNSETSTLENIRVYVRNGIVYLRGTVTTDDDIAIVDELLRDIDGIVEVQNELEVEE